MTLNIACFDDYDAIQQGTYIIMERFGCTPVFDPELPYDKAYELLQNCYRHGRIVLPEGTGPVTGQPLSIDMILSDFQMGSFTGNEVIQTARENDFFGYGILITGCCGIPEYGERFSPEFDIVLSKPLNYDYMPTYVALAEERRLESERRAS